LMKSWVSAPPARGMHKGVKGLSYGFRAMDSD
jgi:hypothetical protein